MKLITKYVANDGVEFSTESACEKHERLLIKVHEVHKLLGKRAKDVGCNFTNGSGYIQHTKEEVYKFKEATDTMYEKYGYRSSSPLNTLSNRLACIDSNDREWGQPYYALNHDKGKQVEWKYLVSKK